MASTPLRWANIFIGGFLAELCVFAIVFSALWLFGQQAFLASIILASAVMPFVFGAWVGRSAGSRFALHGALVGVVAAVIYLILAWGQTQPLLYKVSHVVKVLGGMAGGLVAGRRKPPVPFVVPNH
jgi:hypothetical protein